MSPLGARTTAACWYSELGYPVVLVAAHRLGMMNHVLLTLEVVRNRGLHVLASVVNQIYPLGPHDEDQLAETLACLLPFCGKIDCYGLDYEGSTLFPWP